jgi:hypothetical protein
VRVAFAEGREPDIRNFFACGVAKLFGEFIGLVVQLGIQAAAAEFGGRGDRLQAALGGRDDHQDVRRTLRAGRE